MILRISSRNSLTKELTWSGRVYAFDRGVLTYFYQYTGGDTDIDIGLVALHTNLRSYMNSV